MNSERVDGGGSVDVCTKPGGELERGGFQGACPMEVDLVSRRCTPCRGGVPPLGPDQIALLLSRTRHWDVEHGHHLTRTFKFVDFARALAFVNQVGAIAEEEGHHPDIYLSWGKVRVELWTHKIDGLSENDFIVAAKIDRAYAEGL
jgi:4a-hydroxytetrahydrobiopterin dehydratase